MGDQPSAILLPTQDTRKCINYTHSVTILLFSLLSPQVLNSRMSTFYVLLRITHRKNLFHLIIPKAIIIICNKSILSIKCVFHFSVQRLLETFFAAVNTGRTAVVKRPETYADIWSKFPLLFSDSNETSYVLTNFSRPHCEI